MLWEVPAVYLALEANYPSLRRFRLRLRLRFRRLRYR